MKISSVCADLGMNALIKAAKPGRRECELLAEATRVYFSLGMEIAQCQSIVASGEENLVPLARFAPDKIVRYGELVFVDIGGCFNGIYAELTRTFVCGKANKGIASLLKTSPTSYGRSIWMPGVFSTSVRRWSACAGTRLLKSSPRTPRRR